MWLQTANTLIFFFGVFIGVWQGIRLALLKRQKYPEHTRLALEQFATQAVRQVEKQNPTMSGSSKKQIALASVTTQFKSFKLPIPPADVVDIAIESAVFLLPKNG